MSDGTMQRSWAMLLAGALLVAGCASADVAEDGGATAAPSPPNVTGTGEEWSDDLDGAGVCAAAAGEDIAARVGLAFGDPPAPVDSGDSASCVLTFEDGSSAEVNVWPESVWEGRSPAQAYAYKQEIDAGPEGTIVTELDGVGVQAAAFENPDIDARSVLVQTEGRVFVVVTGGLEGDELAGLAGVLAESL